MIFFFKPKKIHLDCFTNRNDVYSYFPIVEGNKTFPDWWKKLPKISEHPIHNTYEPTMKTCAGFIDYFNNSISIRLWSDLIINLENNESVNNFNWQFSDEQSMIQSHEDKQFSGFVNEINQQHFKILSPWFFSCKEDIQFLWTGNQWNQNLMNKITMLNGSTSFKYQNATNINFMCSRPKINENEKIFLPCGTNLINYFPLSERPIKIHNHLISSEEYVNIYSKHTKISFINKYNKIKKIVQQNENKCPFGFK
jgi:hypothetical protein